MRVCGHVNLFAVSTWHNDDNNEPFIFSFIGGHVQMHNENIL